MCSIYSTGTLKNIFILDLDWDLFTYLEINYKELVNRIMGTDKSYYLHWVSWRHKRANGVAFSSKGLQAREPGREGVSVLSLKAEKNWCLSTGQSGRRKFPLTQVRVRLFVLFRSSTDGILARTTALLSLQIQTVNTTQPKQCLTDVWHPIAQKTNTKLAIPISKLWFDF